MKLPNLMIGIVGAFLVVGYGCGEKDNADITKVSVAEGLTEVTDVGKPTKILAEGSSGIAVEFPANAVPEGSQILAAVVDAPAAFSPGTVQSAAVKITGEYKGEKLTKVTAPMTIALPQSEAALMLTTQEEENDFCVFFQDESEGNWVWRQSDFVSIEEDSGPATINSNRFGTYQLVRCDDGDIEGFSKAKEAGYTGSGEGPLAAISSDPENFSCQEGTKSVYEDFIGQQTCDTYISRYVSCICVTIQNITQEDCVANIRKEIEPKVCVDDDFEVNETVTEPWNQDCGVSSADLVSSYGEICTF